MNTVAQDLVEGFTDFADSLQIEKWFKSVGFEPLNQFWVASRKSTTSDLRICYRLFEIKNLTRWQLTEDRWLAKGVMLPEFTNKIDVILLAQALNIPIGPIENPNA